MGVPEFGSQISNTRYQFYNEYFAITAESGLESSRSLFKSIDPVNRVDISTFELYLNVVEARNDLIISLHNSYEEIFTSAVSLEPMRDAFIELANHIQKFTSDTVDAYLTNTGQQVKNTYARIHRLATGETISATNIKDII